MTALSKFLDAMRDHGIGPAAGVELLGDDVRRRYQVEGDARGTQNGEYVFREDHDGFAVGFARCWKRGETVSWHSKSSRTASDEDRAAWAEKRQAAKVAAEAAERAAREAAARRARQMWDEATPATEHDYATRKGVRVDGLRVWLDVDRFENALLIPVTRGGDMVGMQRIYPAGEKLFVPGSDMKGSSWLIGSLDGASVVAIGEGYSTCDTVAQATGWPVVVAFNAGNLSDVARDVRKRTDARIVFVCDEDLWTWDNKHRKHRPATLPTHDAPEWVEWRQKGWLANRGRVDAEQAAAAIGGAQVLGPAEGGDWNDVMLRDGLDAVRSRLLDAAERVTEPEPEPDWEPVVGPTWDDVSHPLEAINPLGYDRGQFFFFPVATGQIMEFSATSLAQPANLYAMADRTFWDGLYNLDGKMSSRQIADLASGDLMKECRAKGIFNPDNSRGVGVWRDGKSIVVNTGVAVVVDGVEYKPQEYKGKAVYEAGRRVYDVSAPPLRNREASALRDVCRRLNWRQSIMGDLLAGFIVLAPIGGVLKWRPHVVVTGEKGAGKSTVVEKVIKAAIGECGIYLDGGTSEAGMRKEIGLSARPVVMDEGESETKKTKESMEGIFFLARKSSSGSKSATALGRVNVRSCFCVSAINPRIVQGPDKERWSTLELTKNTSPDSQDTWRALEMDIIRLINEDYANGLLARTIGNLPVLLDNIEVFRFSASKALGDARAGDQIGPLIAAAFSLTSDKRVDEAFADDWISKQDWQWRDADVDVPEHEKFLATVLTMRLRYDKDGMARESDIGSLIEMAANVNGLTQPEAAEGLKQIGVMVREGRIIFANTSPKLSSMLRDTVWSEWRRLLMKFEGADNCGNKSLRFGKGISGKATSIPLHHATGDVMVRHDQEDQPF